MKKEQTNADLYLKISADEFLSVLDRYVIGGHGYEIQVYDLMEFLKEPARPYLNEAEKTILKSLDSKYTTITRSKDNDLVVIDAVNICTKYLGGLKPSMFHCIKQDELYNIQELLKGK